MKIEHYIAQLLYRYQCVSVPGFGAFLTEIQPAQLLDDAFYPPKKQVSFNFHLKNNDGLLASHIALSEKITYEQAIHKIEENVSDWKTSLQLFQPISLKNIGELALNSENNLVFKPVDSVNYLTASFGLSHFNSPKIQREIYQQEVEALEEKAPIIFTPERRSKQAYLKYAAIFVMGIGLAGVFGNQYYNNYQEQIATENRLVEESVQKKVEDKIQEATFFIESPLPPVKLNIKEDKFSYHIVAGAFRNESNADKVFKKLSNKGFKAKRISVTRHGLHPVIYGSFATYAEAQKEMTRIQKTENPEAWLLIQDL